jgi:MoaA/NifB/PqqE/SkfB family radical SAM enzyme
MPRRQPGCEYMSIFGLSLDIIAKNLEGYIPPHLFAFMKDAYFSRIKLRPLKQLRLCIHLTDHCNLNCRGCDNFSPIAAERNVDVSVFERDIARISELTGGALADLQLLGGEPLLHPELTRLINTARKYIKSGPIRIVTNGILLLKQPDEFWNCCRENAIQITVTKYPINIAHDKIENLAKKFNVEFAYYGGGGGKYLKKMYCDPLDLEGRQNARLNFIRCHRANNCIELNDGKLYTCETIPNIKYFNAFFGKTLKVNENDYIDIYKAKDINEVLNFLCKPPSFCRYCGIEHRRRDIKWSVSRQELSEWA